MGFTSLMKAQESSLAEQSESLMESIRLCEESHQEILEPDPEGRANPLGCGIAPWAYGSALRLQSLGEIGVERRKERFRHNPGSRTDSERREDERRSQKFLTAGGPDGTKSTILDVLNGLCVRKGR